MSVVQTLARRMDPFRFALLLVSTASVQSMTGYDCSYQYKGVQTYSASEVEACPDYEDWLPNFIPSQTQVLRSTARDEVEVEECDVLVTRIVEFCGEFHSIVYGVGHEVETNSHHKMLKEDCQHLVDTEQMVFRYGINKNETFETNGLGGFSWEFTEYGDSDEGGNCVGAAFTVGDQHFHQHVMRTVIVGQVKKRKYQYNIDTREVQIDKKTRIPVGQKYSYHGRSTMVWRDPKIECQDGIYELYNGFGQLYKSNDSSIAPSMMLVEDFQDGSIFGVELRDPTRICGHEVYSTNMLDIYVTVNETHFNNGLYWQVKNPKKEDDDGSLVDPLENVKALLTRNYIVFSRAFSDALKAISNAICETKRMINKNFLVMMRLNEEEGLLGAFGKGYSAVRKGSVFHVWACTEVDVVYRHLEKDTKDIPISYKNSYNQWQDGYLDAVTEKIKNTTTFLKTAKNLPIGWNFQGTWKCKAGNAVICAAPALLPVDFNVVKDALKQRRGDIVSDGGLDNVTEKPKTNNAIEEQKEFEALADNNDKVKSRKVKLGQQLQDHDYSHIFESAGMPVFQARVNDATENTGAIGLIPTILGVIGVGIFACLAIYRVWYLKRKSNHSFTCNNVVSAVFFPSHLYHKHVGDKAEKNHKKCEEIALNMNGIS